MPMRVRGRRRSRRDQHSSTGEATECRSEVVDGVLANLPEAQAEPTCSPVSVMSDETPRVARRGRSRPRVSKTREKARQPAATTMLEADLGNGETVRATFESDPDPNVHPKRKELQATARPKRPRRRAQPPTAYPLDNAPPSPPAPVSGAARYPGPVASYYAQIPDVRDWLHRCYSRGIAHGALLVEALGSPNHHKKCGQADNVATADRILDRLEEEKWIVRRAYEPTREQLFFGVGGRGPGKRATKGMGHAIEHCWEVNEENEDLRAFLELKPRKEPPPVRKEPSPDTPKADTSEPFWKRMGYARDPNEAPIVGYGFSQCKEVACCECYKQRSRSGYHEDLKGMGYSVPLLRLVEHSEPTREGKCKWCGLEISGASGYLAWLEGKVR